jgi:hypothetical protein
MGQSRQHDATSVIYLSFALSKLRDIWHGTTGYFLIYLSFAEGLFIRRLSRSFPVVNGTVPQEHRDEDQDYRSAVGAGVGWEYSETGKTTEHFHCGRLVLALDSQ